MNRGTLVVVVAALLLASFGCRSATATEPAAPPPNVVLWLFDDLGWGEVGCQGQERIPTPTIDALAARGVRFVNAYSGSPVCAPARCSILTGLHTGHAQVRGNREMGGWGPDEPEGQWPLEPGTRTLAALLQERGYATACFGKWGLGGPGSTGRPRAQGFDRFYGYLCQRVAHNYYPTHLWSDDERDPLAGNDWFSAHQRLEAPPESWSRYRGATYAPDRMIEEAIRWIDAQASRPFFVYFATPVPHAALQVPDAELDAFPEAWDAAPYLGAKGYLPHPRPRAAYAAMVARADRDLGRLLAAIDARGASGETLVIVTSDNGPTFNGGTDSEFFASSGGLRGRKTQLYEGGIRVPLVVAGPGVGAAGTIRATPVAGWDLMPTILDVVGADAAPGGDGRSLVPLLRGGDATALAPRALYWEHAGDRAARIGRWKLLDRRGEAPPELYDLDADPGETIDRAAEQPERVADLLRRLEAEHDEVAAFPLRR